MARDKFKGNYYGISSIPSSAEIVVPSDTVDLPNVCRRIHIGVGGDLKVDMKDVGIGIVFKNLPTGGEKNGAFTRIYNVGTTATNLIAEW
jgi:hypothetical protein